MATDKEARQHALGAAERLYDRLVGRDPAAWTAMQALVKEAQGGNTKALAAWKLIGQVHGQKKRMGWGQIPPGKLEAAKRLYSRMKLKDPAAWETFKKIVDEAKKGNPKAHQAFAVMSQEHNERKADAIISGRYHGGGYHRGPSYTMGLEFGGYHGGGYRRGPSYSIGGSGTSVFPAHDILGYSHYPAFFGAPVNLSTARRAELLSLIRRALSA